VPALWAPTACNWHRIPVHRHYHGNGDDEALPNSIEPATYRYREAQFREGSARESRLVFDLMRWRYTEAVILVLKEGGHLVLPPSPCPQEGKGPEHRVSGAMMRLAPSRRGSAESPTAGRGDDTTRRRDRERAPGAPRPGRTFRNLPGVHAISPSGPGTARRRSHARSCFVWPRYLQRVTYLWLTAGAYCQREQARWTQRHSELGYCLSLSGALASNGKTAASPPRA